VGEGRCHSEFDANIQESEVHLDQNFVAVVACCHQARKVCIGGSPTVTVASAQGLVLTDVVRTIGRVD
jgi:hypothetical protein